MIYFFENIEPFVSANGMKVTPNKVGTYFGTPIFCLSSHWREEIEANGAVVIEINKEFLVKETGING